MSYCNGCGLPHDQAANCGRSSAPDVAVINEAVRAALNEGVRLGLGFAAELASDYGTDFPPARPFTDDLADMFRRAGNQQSTKETP